MLPIGSLAPKRKVRNTAAARVSADPISAKGPASRGTWAGSTPALPEFRVNDYRPGSLDDFERLYQTSYGKVLGTLIRILRDRAAAEDCTQDAFERAYRHWPAWRPEAPAEAWVNRIAVNAAISYQRKTRLSEVDEVIRRLGRPGPGPDPQELEHCDLTAALAALPPKEAATIVLRYLHGYTNRAISRATGTPERTVSSRLAHGRQQLRKALAPSLMEAG